MTSLSKHKSLTHSLWFSVLDAFHFIILPLKANRGINKEWVYISVHYTLLEITSVKTNFVKACGRTLDAIVCLFSLWNRFPDLMVQNTSVLRQAVGEGSGKTPTNFDFLACTRIEVHEPQAVLLWSQMWRTFILYVYLSAPWKAQQERVFSWRGEHLLRVKHVIFRTRAL